VDDDILVLILATMIALPVVAGVVAYLRLRLRQSRAVVPMSAGSATAFGAMEPRFEISPRLVRPAPEIKADVEACMDRLFVKSTAPGRYAGVVVDDIPSVVLHQLDTIIEKNAYIKHTQNIVAKIDSMESNIESLVSLVAGDPLLSATLMRHANSPFYGARSEVTSLKFAIELIGVANLKNLVYREYVLREHRGKPAPDPALFALVWEHALLSATAAAALSPAFPGTDPANAYTVALLHDIGKFLLMSSGLIELDPGSCALPYQGGFHADTKRLWRYDHALAGKIAALKWDFGPEIAGAIGMHHYAELLNLHHLNISSAQAQNLALIHVANQVAKYFSREPRAANHVAPLHFSFHRVVDQGAVRAILSGSNLISELDKTRASMAFDTDS